MVTYVFDSSAILRYLDDEAGSNRIEAILAEHATGTAELLIPAIQWGEIAGIVRKRKGYEAVQPLLEKLRVLGFVAVPLSPDCAVRAAMLRIETQLPYADAMIASFAEGLNACKLITADFDFKAVANLLKIEFLIGKSEPA